MTGIRHHVESPQVPRYGLIALIVACALFMESLDGTVIATSLPAIARDLHQDPISLKLALTSYLLSLAIFIPASGWAADKFGARTIFRSAIVIFTLGSILCGFSSTLWQFVVARIIQGVGGAMMVPVGRLVLLRSVPKSEVVSALAYLTIPALLGPLCGPLIGGFITTYFHWRWIFFVNVPIGILGIVLVSLYIKDVRGDAWPLDVPGFLLSGCGLAALIFGMTLVGRGIVGTNVVVALVSVGILLLGAYYLHARRAKYPILDLNLLKVPTFRAAVVGGSLFRVGVGATPLLLPLMLQIGFGLNAFQSGSITFITSLGAMAMKTTAAPILRTFGFRHVLLFNSLLSSTLLGCYGLFTPTTPHLLMMALLLCGGFFRSLEFTSINAITYADIDHAGMSRATSFSSVAQQLSLSVGITAGALLLQTAQAIHGTPHLTRADFPWGFLGVALISACSVFWFARLPVNAGAEMSARPGKIVEEAKG
jgi:EmrB/QacA subfamily drug resistance transporter